MRFSSSPLTAYPLLTVEKWRRKKIFLNVPLKVLHETSGRFLNITHTCRAKMLRVIAKTLNIYLAFWKTVQFAQ